MQPLRVFDGSIGREVKTLELVTIRFGSVLQTKQVWQFLELHFTSLPGGRCHGAQILSGFVSTKNIQAEESVLREKSIYSSAIQRIKLTFQNSYIKHSREMQAKAQSAATAARLNFRRYLGGLPFRIP